MFPMLYPCASTVGTHWISVIGDPKLVWTLLRRDKILTSPRSTTLITRSYSL